jgi:hypothetical protein
MQNLRESEAFVPKKRDLEDLVRLAQQDLQDDDDSLSLQ